MLIEANHEEEVRVAIVENNRLVDFDYENVKNKSLKGNIYLGKIVRIEPSLQAAFVEYGGNRHGFLPFSEIHPDYFRIPVEDRPEDVAIEDPDTSLEAGSSEDLDMSDMVDISRSDDFMDVDDIEAASEEKPVSDLVRAPIKKYKIQEVVHSRQVILVQVTKEERGNKGAALTSYIALAGRYCVLMPNASNTGGISRKITDMGDRRRLKDLIQEFGLPDGMALIVRTAGMDRSKTEVKRDFNFLMSLWGEIREATINATAPSLIYEEADLVRRAIRDLYGRDTDEIFVEGKEAYRTAKAFMRKMMPSHAKRVHLYKEESTPLFFKHSIERQIEEMFHTQVKLKSGGYLVINPTEALVSIDVNSGRATKERHIDSTALKTNLEAATEVARQVRLRDLAGLIVVDFIDMSDAKHNQAVEKRLKDGLSEDRARTQTGRISMFGLLEFSRQRLRPSLIERSSKVCADCHGAGFIRSTVSIILQLFRVLGETCLVSKPKKLNILVPTDVGFYLLNEKRVELAQLESKYNVVITLTQDDACKGGFSVRGEDDVVIYDTFKLAEEESQGKSVKKPKSDKAVGMNKPRGKDPKNVDQKKRQPSHGKKQEKGREQPLKEETVSTEIVATKDVPKDRPQEEDGEEKTGRRRRNRRGGRRRREEREGDAQVQQPKEEKKLVHTGVSGDKKPSEDQKLKSLPEKVVPSDEDRVTKVDTGSKDRSRRTRQKKSEKSGSEGESSSDGPASNAGGPQGRRGWWKRLLDS